MDQRADREFGRSIGNLDEIFAFVESFAASTRIVGEDLFALKLATEELFTNMVKYNSSEGDRISISLWRNGSMIGLELRDYRVAPTDPDEWSSADLSDPWHERKIGGMGVHLVRRTMDELEYTYERGTMIVRAHKQVR